MSESLLSVGLDVGTTTTQLIVSRLQVENQAGSFAVPQMQIMDRQVIYRGDVHFTPLVDESHVDGERIRQLVAKDYEAAGIRSEDVDTGAIIITGETSRKENAAAVLQALSGFAGDFVAATAGPDLESVLAAKGAGAVAWSKETGRQVLHMDIGGGTSNLALIENGKIVQTGCLNVGGRLLKFDKSGKVTYISPVLRGLTDLQIGDYPTQLQIESVAQILTHGLEMAAGLRPRTELLDKLLTKEAAAGWDIPEAGAVLSFSGGVAECIDKKYDAGTFGDMGTQLGRAIKNSLLCAAEYMLGQETIRATVIGAGCHSAQLSGSTVFFRGIDLPVKNLPVAIFSAREQEKQELPELINRRIRELDTQRAVLFFPGYSAAGYEQVAALAEKISAAGLKELFLCLEGDMAKALGQRLSLMLGATPCLCIDRVQLAGECFLDIGKPVGPALPVVVKTLVLENGGNV